MLASLAHMLKRKFGSEKDRKILTEIIMRRSTQFTDTGRIQTGGFMSEMPKSLDLMVQGDEEH